MMWLLLQAGMLLQGNVYGNVELNALEISTASLSCCTLDRIIFHSLRVFATRQTRTKITSSQGKSRAGISKCGMRLES